MPTIRCPNCEALMDEGESCPECPHADNPDCECEHCELEAAYGDQFDLHAAAIDQPEEQDDDDDNDD